MLLIIDLNKNNFHLHLEILLRSTYSYMKFLFKIRGFKFSIFPAQEAVERLGKRTLFSYWQYFLSTLELPFKNRYDIFCHWAKSYIVWPTCCTWSLVVLKCRLYIWNILRCKYIFVLLLRTIIRYMSRTVCIHRENRHKVSQRYVYYF